MYPVVKLYLTYYPSCIYCLVGLVVRRPPQERKIPGLNPACAGIFPGSSHTSDLKIGTPAATLPGTWRYRVSTWTGRPGVSILWLGEVERLICNFSVWQHIKLSEQIRPWDTLACCWDVKQPTNSLLHLLWPDPPNPFCLSQLLCLPPPPPPTPPFPSPITFSPSSSSPHGKEQI